MADEIYEITFEVDTADGYVVLQHGEARLPADAARRLGPEVLAKLNQSSRPTGFAKGGVVSLDVH